MAVLDLLGHDRRCWSAPSPWAALHTLLWLPRALQMRRELREEEAAEERAALRAAQCARPQARSRAGEAAQAPREPEGKG